MKLLKTRGVVGKTVRKMPALRGLEIQRAYGLAFDSEGLLLHWTGAVWSDC